MIFRSRSDLLGWSRSVVWSLIFDLDPFTFDLVMRSLCDAYLICQKKDLLRSSFSRKVMKRCLFYIIWKTDFRSHQCDIICDITQQMSPSLEQQSDLLRWSWSRSWSFLFKWSFGKNDLDHLSDLDLWSRSLFKWSSRTLAPISGFGGATRSTE